MTILEKRACELQATRETYWRAMREVCARLRQERRRGWPLIWAAESDYRLLAYYLREWREARNAQQKIVHIHSRRAA